MKQLNFFPDDDNTCPLCGTPMPVDRVMAGYEYCEDCEKLETENYDDTWVNE